MIALVAQIACWTAGGARAGAAASPLGRILATVPGTVCWATAGWPYCAPPPGSGAGGAIGSVGTSGAVDETPPPLVGLCPVAEAHGIATSTAASVNVRPRRRNSLQT